MNDDEWEDCQPPSGASSLRVHWQRDDRGRMVVTEVRVSADCVTGTMLRTVSPATLGARRNAEATLHIAVSRKPIRRPDGTDSFYGHVAVAYREYAETGAPAKAIAEEANVPVTTVHRWIREARRLGFLPAARQGKVG